MVEVVLLGFTSGVDAVRSRHLPSGRQEWRSRNTRSWQHAFEAVPETRTGFRLRFPPRRSGCSRWLGPTILLCLRLRHQVPQFPEEIKLMATVLTVWLAFETLYVGPSLY